MQYQKVYAIIIERNSLSWKGNNSETILFSAIDIMFNFIDTSELDKVTELNEHSFPVVRLDKAEELGLDNEALEVGRVLNEIVTDIETNGESTDLARMDRSLFPIGSYGNYCGYGK
nr:hypothetical protein [Streptococcus sp. 3167]